MSKILETVLSHVPQKSDITDACFEGANIVLYTKNQDFALNNKEIIRKMVNDVKKRVEIRPDPKLTVKPQEAKKIIKDILPEDAKVDNILFDEQRSRVIIEAENPGAAIGKGAEVLKEIKAKTYWVPLVKRTPSIRSPLIENIRNVLYEYSEYRRKFLHKVGEAIYKDWSRDKKEQWVRLSCLGAAREVGRSSFILQTPESQIMLDCGINVAAPPKYAFPFLNAPEFNFQDLTAVVLSHAHLDHCGTIPYLFKMGFRGPVYCTAPTRDVAALLALDYINISNKEGKAPLYTTADVKEMVKHTVCLSYEEVTDIAADMRLTFYNAGHTLGSSLCHLNVGNGYHNFIYTGDFNYENSNLLAAAATKFPRLETAMMESTYGTKKQQQKSRYECEEEMAKLISDTVNQGGKVLLPVLGVGRAQEIQLIIEKLVREKKMPEVPVYMQGILWDVTAIHTAYPEFFNPKVQKSIFLKGENPFLNPIFKHVTSQKEMKQIIDGPGPYIVMATSGMMTGGASVEYFKHFAESKKNMLIQTSYQGEGSLGRRLQNGEKEIIFKEGTKQNIVYVNMSIHTIHGFSGHSNFKQLTGWVKNLRPKPRKVIAIHGEQSRCIELASTIYQQNRIETVAPKNLEVIRLR